MWSILPCTECAPRATTTWTTTRTTTSRTSTSSTVFISTKLVFGNALTANSSESVCGCVRGNNLNLDFHRCRSQTATLFNSSDMMIYRFFDRTHLTYPGQTVDVHVHVREVFYSANITLLKLSCKSCAKQHLHLGKFLGLHVNSWRSLKSKGSISDVPIISKPGRSWQRLLPVWVITMENEHQGIPFVLLAWQNDMLWHW